MKREKIVFLFHFVLMIDSAIHNLLQTLFLTVSKYFVYSNHTYRDIVLSFGFLKFSLAGGCKDIRNNVPLSAVYQLRPQPSWWLNPVHLQQGFSLLRDSLSRISLQVPRQRQPLRGVLETYSLYDALDLRRGRNGRFCRAFSKGARESKCKVPATRFCAVLCFAVLPPTGDHWRSFFLQDTRPLPAA